ncbi:MAG: hypothetical protein ABR968_08960 [Bacteroidales bacterium]
MKYFLLIFLSIYLISCGSSGKKEEGILAKVYNEYLFKTDLIGLVPSSTSSKDSISIVKKYINNWIKQKLVIHNAESNLSSKQKDFKKQLNDYRNSLIVFVYEKELVRQKLDTTVTDEDIKSYYEKNKNNFLLKDNIVKVWYVKMPLKSNYSLTVENLYKLETPQARQKLEEYCKKYAVNSYLDDSTWLYFNDLLKEIPIKTYNQEDYLKFHRYIEMDDSLYSYYVNIKGFQIKESLSPLNFEKENIRQIILNKRKLMLIEDMQNEIFKEALKNNDFEIY